MYYFNENQKEYIRDVGRSYKLSRRELEAFILLFYGYNNREIGERLYVTEKTIKFHLGNIFKKMKVNSRYKLFWLHGLDFFRTLINLEDKDQQMKEVKTEPSEVKPKMNNTILPQSKVSTNFNEAI